MGDERLPLTGLAAQLVRDGKAVAQAEFKLARTKLTLRISAAKTGAILLVAAVVIALLALIALTVGLMMALATLIGFGFAALVTCAVLLIVAAVIGWLGLRQLSTKPHAMVEDVR